MSTLLFFLAFGTFLTAILNMLPTATLPLEIAFAFKVIFSYMAVWNFLLPFDHMFIAFKVILGMELMLLGWWIIEWVISIVRGSTQ